MVAIVVQDQRCSTHARPAAPIARARAMGRAGRAWVEQRWSWTTIAAGFAGLLEPGDD